MFISRLLLVSVNIDTLFYMLLYYSFLFYFFFFNDPATTEIYTLSLHDALPICVGLADQLEHMTDALGQVEIIIQRLDRKSTRLNSSHRTISYAVFCLKKKKKYPKSITTTTPPNNLAPSHITILHYSRIIASRSV